MKAKIEPRKLGSTIEKLRTLLGGEVKVLVKASNEGMTIFAVRTPELESEEADEGEGEPIDLRNIERQDYFG